MITIETVEEVITEQENQYKTTTSINRERNIPLSPKRICIVTGVRRCGKSTFLRQFDKKANKLSINLEDPRLEGFSVSDFIKIEKIAEKRNCRAILLDEIQNIPEWEKYARSANERGVQLFITGSNASMLSREFGTRLTGRYQQIELFPFSYNEFLKFTNQKGNADSFKNFLVMGGFPEYLEEKNPEYLRTLLRDIIMRDIAVRRGIRNEHYLIRLAVYLLSNIGKEFSYNKITKTLEIKSVRTTIDLCDYLKESYLIELLPRFSFSIHQQLANPKKAYGIDTAMAKANSLSFTDDQGRLFENAVFLQLRRTSNEISYYNNGKSECDFVVKENGKVISIVQACVHVHEDNLKREIQGVKDAMLETNCTKGFIITLDQEDELDGIPLIPAWKWMSKK